MQEFNPKKQLKSTISEPYNTVKGIAKSLTSLDAFKRIITERYIAGHYRDEKLREFYVLGRFYLGENGCCMLSDEDIKARFPLIPDVLSRKDFWKFIRESLGAGEKDFRLPCSSINLPPEHLLCPECKKPWTLKNYLSTIECSDENSVISLKDFIGKTINEVQTIFSKRTDAVYQFGFPQKVIRNDRFIDTSLDPECERYNTLNPQHPMLMNKNGWAGEKEGITGHYIIQEGDDGYIIVWTFYHKGCHKKIMRERKKNKTQPVSIIYPYPIPIRKPS